MQLRFRCDLDQSAVAAPVDASEHRVTVFVDGVPADRRNALIRDGLVLIKVDIGKSVALHGEFVDANEEVIPGPTQHRTFVAEAHVDPEPIHGNIFGNIRKITEDDAAELESDLRELDEPVEPAPPQP